MSPFHRVVWCRVWPVVVLGLLAAGCGRSGDEAANPAKVTWQTPTDDECRRFAKSLEEQVCGGNVDAFVAAIDWDAMLDHATAGIEAPEENRRAFINGARKGLSDPRGGLRQTVQQAAVSGGYRFLCMQSAGDEKRSLFRLLTPEGGLNYHRLVLGRMADGKLRAVDMYVFATGETFSQTIRRMYLPVAAEASKSVLARLTKSESDFIKNIKTLEQMSLALRDGRNAQLLDLYKSLPHSLQKEKIFLLMRVKAAPDVSEKEYAEALDAFRDACPGDACLDLLLIDHYVMKKEYDRALGCIDALDKAVGGDPYLNAMRANMYVEKQDFAKARECAQKAVAAEETLEPAYWSLIAACLGVKDFAETSRQLTAIHEKCGVEIGDLTTTPEYAEFIKSPAYKEWLEEQGRDEEK